MLFLIRIRLSVNAIIFLAPISAFDQVLAEVRADRCSPACHLNRLIIDAFRIHESIAWRIPYCCGVASSQTSSSKASQLFFSSTSATSCGRSSRQEFSSKIICLHMVTGLMITSRWRSVRAQSALLSNMGKYPFMMYFFLPDIRNKFGSLHNQLTPNRVRELFSMFYIEYSGRLSDGLATVHYTAVTDKAKTAQIIANGTFYPFFRP